MKLRRALLPAGLAVGVAVLAAGCASPSPVEAPDPIVIGCAEEAPPTEVFVGESVEVTRGPDGPCDGLAVGRTQTFTFRSVDRTSSVGSSVFAEIEENGSFSFQLEVPADMQLGRAVLEAVPRVNPCNDDASLDCPPPTAHVIVRYRPTALRAVTLVQSRLEVAPPAGGGIRAFASRGPGANQVTIVLPATRCETVPTAFVAGSPRNSLELIAGPPPSGSCLDHGTFRTSILEVPRTHADYTTVKVDNVPLPLLPAS